MTSIYGGFEHVEEDLRPTVCYRNGGQRCGCGSEPWQTAGWCNMQEQFAYDDSWLKAKDEMNELLKGEKSYWHIRTRRNMNKLWKLLLHKIGLCSKANLGYRCYGRKGECG